MISDGQWDSVFGLGFGRLQGGFSADVVDTFQSISDDRVWIVAFGKQDNFSCGLQLISDEHRKTSTGNTFIICPIAEGLSVRRSEC